MCVFHIYSKIIDSYMNNARYLNYVKCFAKKWSSLESLKLRYNQQ